MTLVGRYVCDRYRILRKVGEGGMGEVFAAEDVLSGRLVALKVMRRDTADPATPERFLREAETLARLRSRNIVRLYDFERDMDLGILFVAMELAMGDDLVRLLHHGRLRPALALRVVQQVCTGLSAAHELGIVHRDLKPANLKLKPKTDHSVRVKILDFGLVRDKHSSATLTDVGKVPGTLTYMPPEVLQERELDHRGDLYSLGVIFYEMLLGIAPFTAKSRVEVAMKHLREEPTPIASVVPERLPDGVAELVHELLIKEPNDRIDSAAEVAERVAEIAERDELQFAVQHKGASHQPFHDWDLLPHI